MTRSFKSTSASIDQVLEPLSSTSEEVLSLVLSFLSTSTEMLDRTHILVVCVYSHTQETKNQNQNQEPKLRTKSENQTEKQKREPN